MTKYEIGTKIKRIARGNLENDTWLKVKGKITTIADKRRDSYYLDKASGTFSKEYLDSVYKKIKVKKSKSKKSKSKKSKKIKAGDTVSINADYYYEFIGKNDGKERTVGIVDFADDFSKVISKNYTVLKVDSDGDIILDIETVNSWTAYFYAKTLTKIKSKD